MQAKSEHEVETRHPSRVVVLGWGNTSRGDDAIGPLLLEEVQQAGWPGVETVEDFQLQIEHSLDLVGADLVLFVDAGIETPAPFTFREVQAHGNFTASTHALAPEAVLAVYQQVQRRPPPPAFVLCVRGENFKLGHRMSDAATESMGLANAFLKTLLQAHDEKRWRQIADEEALRHPSR